MAKVLLVEDDELLADNLTKWLVSERHGVDRARNCADARGFFAAFQYEIIILDWELPDGSGAKVCAEIRAKGIKTPVLMLTARVAVQDRVIGLDLGADDYVSKPCLPEELGARIRALLRRHEPTTVGMKTGTIELNETARSLIASGVSVQLSANEFEAFLVLMRHPGTVLSAEALVALSQARGGTLSRSSIKVHVSRIKTRFSNLGLTCPISAVSGGYLFSEATEKHHE